MVLVGVVESLRVKHGVFWGGFALVAVVGVGLVEAIAAVWLYVQSFVVFAFVLKHVGPWICGRPVRSVGDGLPNLIAWVTMVPWR